MRALEFSDREGQGPGASQIEREGREVSMRAAGLLAACWAERGGGELGRAPGRGGGRNAWPRGREAGQGGGAGWGLPFSFFFSFFPVELLSINK